MGNSEQNCNQKTSVQYSDKEIDVLRLLFEEWKYRQTTLWSLLIKATTFAFVLIFLPLLYENLKVKIDALKIPLYLLPLTGILLSIVISVFSMTEMFRIHRIKMCIKDNIKLISEKFDGALSKGNKYNNYIPLAICFVQTAIAIFIILRII